MQFFLGLLAAIGLRVPAVQAAVVALIQRYVLASTLRAKIIRYVVTSLAGAAVTLREEFDELQEGVRLWLSKMIGEVIENLDRESILHAGGKAAAKSLAKNLAEKYGIAFPIPDLYSETIAEELGAWVAEVINDKLSERLGRPVQIVTTVFPPDQIATELDSFVTEEINTKLGINISSVIYNDNLATELKTNVVQKLSEEMTNIIARIKGEEIARLQAQGLNGEELLYRVGLVTTTVNDLLTRFSTNQVFGFSINAKAYYSQNKKKIHNRMRQREYRRTHVEVRHWEAR